MDLNSLGSQGTYTLQNNFNPKGDYGLSDFDARNHFVFSGTWNLPFHGNSSLSSRLVEGWMLANITQLQSGNPLNVTTTSTYNGVSGTIRPTLLQERPPDDQFGARRRERGKLAGEVLCAFFACGGLASASAGVDSGLALASAGVNSIAPGKASCAWATRHPNAAAAKTTRNGFIARAIGRGAKRGS